MEYQKMNLSCPANRKEGNGWRIRAPQFNLDHSHNFVNIFASIFKTRKECSNTNSVIIFNGQVLLLFDTKFHKSDLAVCRISTSATLTS